MYLNKIARAEHFASAAASCRNCAARLHGLCAALDDDDLGALRQCGTVRRLAADAALVHHRDPVREVVTVVKGVLRLSHLFPDGRRQIAAFAFPGEFLGISGVTHHYFTIEAVTAVDLCVVPRTRFEEFVGSHPRMATPLYAAAAHELAKTREHLVSLGRKTAQERVATFILQMAEHSAQKPGEPVLANLPMSRTDIADHLGLRIETVCRELAILKAVGLVTLDGPQEILVHDADSLRARACEDYDGTQAAAQFC